MKKIFISLMMALVAISTQAQEGTQNIGLLLGFGETICRERRDAADTKLSDVFKLDGPTFGFVYETSLWKGLGFQVGLSYRYGVLLGKWTSPVQFENVKWREVNAQHRLEIPIDWQYKFLIAKDTYLSVYTGPTVQCNIVSNTKFYFRNNTQIPTELIREVLKLNDVSSKEYFTTLSYDNDDIVDYHRWNITWGVGIGLQYKQYFLRGGYDFGILNPYHDKFYNNAFGPDYNRRGRVDQWQIKLGIYIWQHE